MLASESRLNNILKYCYWVLIFGLAADFTPQLIKTVRAANATRIVSHAKVVPYTVTLQDYVVGSNGISTPTAKMTVAVRSDGSRAIEADQTIQGKPWDERILNFSSGLKSYVMESSRQKSTTFDASRNISSVLPSPANDCVIPGREQQAAGAEEVGSYRTEKIIYGNVTQWLALDYGCAVIKARAEWIDGQASEKRLVSLVPGEPPPSLFDVPAGFEEMPPSKLFPGPSAANQDVYYYAHRPQ